MKTSGKLPEIVSREEWLTAFGRQAPWEEPAGRAEPLGLQVGGPAMRLLDQYDA